MKDKLEDATRNVAMGNLRAFVTLMVVFHHAVLAYTSGAPELGPFATPPLMWSAYPVVDTARFAGFDLVVGYDDMFFMSLMFFLSGLFVVGSLRRKGVAGFLRDRAVRLGVPFVFGAAILAPLAYLPAFLQRGEHGFAAAWLSLPSWPAGPVWFLWVLLAFDVLAAAALPRCEGALARVGLQLRRPIVFFLAMIVVTGAVYVPLALALDSWSWASFGPFFVQSSRVGLYAAWFFAGAAIGAAGLEQAFLLLARRWWAWAIASLVTFLAEIVLFLAMLAKLGAGEKPATAVLVSLHVGYVVACAAACLAFLAVFARFARRTRISDSLTANAYGIYVFHYAIVSWACLALVGVGLPAIVKGPLVFAIAVSGSWAITAALRRLPRLGAVVGAPHPVG